MVETRSQIGFEQAGIGTVLRHNKLVVPPNQREFAWQEREVTQLFKDFARAINEGDYFLGTIVTIPREDHLEVVDGQQRLATTAIMLAAIRDHLQGKEDVLVESINNEFLTGIDRVQRERVSKLTLNIDDRELFSWIVAHDRDADKPQPQRGSHERLLAAYDEASKHVQNIVSALDSKDHGDLLNAWVSFVEHKALVILLRVPNDADAYKMFETLNDRGLRTSQADLIKNYLFGRAGVRMNEVQERWAYMRGTLESLEEEDITVNFLRHALIVQSGHLREAEVYDAVQDKVKSQQASVSFVSTLEALAHVYVATFNPEHKNWNGYPDAARRAVEVFNLINIRPFRPLLLAIAWKMKDPREAAQSFEFLISLGVRLLIAATTRSGSVEELLAESAHRVFEGAIDTAKDLKQALAAITPKDQAFREALEVAKVTNSRLARYYLRSLEMAAKQEPEPWFVPLDDRTVINLEHVLPKKPAAEHWPQFNEDEVAAYSNRLGNLALIRASDNSDIKGDAFGEKKKVYAACPYVLTSQIADADEWTPTSIFERQKTLAPLGVAAWPI